MLLAFGLMGLILVGSNWIYHKMGLIPPDAPATTQQKKATVAPLPNSSGPLPGQTATPEATAPPPTAESAPVAPIAATNKQTWFVDTDVYHVVFSNEGAVVQSWTLKGYHDANGQPCVLELELTEPSLFFAHSAGSAGRFAEAILAWPRG